MTTDEVALIIALSTLGVGLIHYILRFVYKSRCEHCSLCFGLVDVDRGVETERKEQDNRGSVNSTDSLNV
jgi:hypothetical protein